MNEFGGLLNTCFCMGEGYHNKWINHFSKVKNTILYHTYRYVWYKKHVRFKASQNVTHDFIHRRNSSSRTAAIHDLQWDRDKEFLHYSLPSLTHTHRHRHGRHTDWLEVYCMISLMICMTYEMSRILDQDRVRGTEMQIRSIYWLFRLVSYKICNPIIVSLI